MGYVPACGERVSNVEEALRLAGAGGAQELIVCGGGDAYAAAMPHADRLILTHVNANLKSGVPFPKVDPILWQMTEREDFPPDAMHEFGMRFAKYARRSPPAAQL